MRQPRTPIRWTLLSLVIGALACSSTTFQSTWRAPDARPLQLRGRKVVGLFISKNPTIRHTAENAMAREITARGAQGVPAYTVLSDAEERDQDRAKAKVDSMGFSGMVVMRVVGRETQYSYEAPTVWARPYYRHMWGGYWGWGWQTVGTPGYLTADRVVKVETLVYSMEQDQLVWAGISKTVDPAHIDNFIGELASAVADRMEKDGLLQKQ
ncbi:MAG: hypothetical protein ABI968_11130 [Acidobacteriota bacterium]